MSKKRNKKYECILYTKDTKDKQQNTKETNIKNIAKNK